MKKTGSEVRVQIPSELLDGQDYRVELSTVFHDPPSRPGAGRQPVPYRVICVVDRITHEVARCSFCGQGGSASTLRVSGVECWRDEEQLPDTAAQITLMRDSLGRLFGDRVWCCAGCQEAFLASVQENVDASGGIRLRSIGQATAA